MGEQEDEQLANPHDGDHKAGHEGDHEQAHDSDHNKTHSHSPKENFLPLLLIVAAVVAAAVVTNTFNTVLVLFSIVLMVMIHEFGHFLTAKWSGMKVTEYFLGFGPRLWSFRRGETEYGIKAIPAGGYVRITGMSNLEKVDDEDEARTYRQQSYWKRMLVASAGSFMHFVMAFLILVLLFGVLGTRPAAVIGAYSQDIGASPARESGLVEGDRVKRIDGVEVTDWRDLQTIVGARPNQRVDVVVQRGNSELTMPVTLADRTALADRVEVGSNPQSIGYLGARRGDVYLREPFVQSLSMSATAMVDAAKLSIGALIDRFSPSGIESLARQVRDARANGQARSEAEKANAPAPVTETSEDEARLVSPLGLVNFSHQAAEAGIRPVLQFLFSVNLFVGIFNLIPLLPFDGGHMAIATYERLRSFGGRRHRVDFAKMLPLSYAVLFVLVSLGVSALWLDAWYPVQDTFG